MTIAENVEFIKDLPLSKQSDEFRQWYNENINSQITDKIIPDSLDDYNRPISFTLKYDVFTVKVFWVYALQDSSSWACSDFNIQIS
jgi:hypothetical protein